jgi:fibronectin-binding autotransporter adhesin
MKPTSNPFLRVSIAVASLALATVAHAADLTWNNGASTGAWNTSDANWTGSTWNNGTPDNAIFYGTGGTVTLASGITAGSVSVGNSGGNFASLTLSGGTLNASSLTVQGWGNNSGAYGSNPTLTVNSAVSISGDATIGRANLDITGGTFTANRIISAPASADWGRLVISGGTVTATNGVDGSVNTGATFQIDLNGGTLYTPFIKVADREAGTNNNAWLNFNGGTVKATASTTTFITTYGGGNNVFISGGGAIIDSNGFDITIGTVFQGGGALTKNGAGTLKLTQSNNHTGGTTVNGGMLVLAANAWTLNNVSSGGVTVGSGATLRADNSVANQLNGLTLNGGTVEAINSSGNGDWGDFFLTGSVSATGTSNMNADIALRATNVDFSVASGGTLNVGGKIHNGYGYNGQATGGSADPWWGTVPSTVSKSGTGTMTMTSTHTYTGATTVSAGTLKVSGSIANSDVTVNGGVLASGSTGTVGKIVTVNTGATFAAGDVGAVGTANVADDLNFASGSIFDWDLTTATNTYDKVTVADQLNITTGAKFNVVSSTAFTDTFWDTAHTWSDIFGSLNIDNFTVANFLYSGSATAPTAEGYFTVSGSSLTWTAVPEPTSALAGLLLTAGLLRRRR